MKLLLVVFALLGSSLATGDTCQTNCPTDYTPVCASNGMSFSNECALQRESCLSGLALTTAQTGTCSITCPDLCPFDYQPVCANTGKTYSNYCTLLLDICQLPESARSTVAVAQLGECPVVEAPCPDMCPMNYEPVCGSNGRTFSNACILRQRACALGIQITALHNGECEEVDCPTMCSSDYQPVCGTDGVTYSNLCALDTAACLAKSSVSVASDGECPVVEEPCPEMCSQEYGPVCGSDWKTYANECSLKAAACNLKVDITILAHTECNDVPCNMRCSSEAKPVCGSDGVTHPNQCLMSLASCEQRRLITSLHDGVCTLADCNMVCPEIYAPLCGTNRNTFSSLCQYDSAHCKALLANPPQSLGIAHEGICTQEITQTTEFTWEIIREFDTNNDQVISFEEFKVLAALLYPEDSEEEIKIFFEATDSNGDGFITAEEGENFQPMKISTLPLYRPIPLYVAASVLGVVLIAIVVAAVILAKKRGLKHSLKDNDSLEDTTPDTPEKVSI